MNKYLITLAAAAVASLSAYAQTANYNLASRFSQRNISQMVGSTSITPHWFADSDRFWYRWTDSQGSRYYLVDPAKGTKTEIFDMAELAMKLTEAVRDPFDAQHIPFRDLRLKDDDTLEFSIKSTRDEGKDKKKIYYFEYKLSAKQLVNVTAEHKDKDRYPQWAAVSPDGTKAVYVKGYDMFWMDSTSLHKIMKDEKDSTIVEHRLTWDGTQDASYASDSYMGDTEKLDTTKRRSVADYAWSPDSRHMAFIRWDMSKLSELWVINSIALPRPSLETYKYQMPGEAGPKGDLFILEAENGKIRSVKSHAFKDQDMSIERGRSLSRDQYKEWHSSVWEGDGNGFYLERGSRDLHRIDLCYVGVDADSTRTLVTERLNTYNETRRVFPVNGGRQFIWWSERNGWANLYLYNADGSLVRNLTAGAYHVEDVLAYNEKENYIVFSACGLNKGENPYQMHNYRLSLAGGRPISLDMDDMNVNARVSDDARYLVANCSRVDYKPFSILIDSRSGKKIMDLQEADFSRLFAAGYKFPERFKVKAADGITDLYGAMYKPFDFDSTKVYPILDYVYPGPQVEANNIEWTAGMTRTDRLAQIGFVVITVGNRGGHPNRSKWYHNYGYGNLRDYGLADQKYAIEQLAARHSFIDINRVGIHGHSGGGFMSTAAILQYPDFFKVAVSCAGNHDNSIYNRWWSETHHGVREVVEQGDTTFVYHIETNPEIASRLKGHLMLVHGDIDNNVHPANTIRVVNALIRANKRFDMLLLPGQRHGFGDMNEYFFWRMADYYSEWLLDGSRRSEVDIIQLNNDR